MISEALTLTLTLTLTQVPASPDGGLMIAEALEALAHHLVDRIS